jgi:hypothetical protein
VTEDAKLRCENPGCGSTDVEIVGHPQYEDGATLFGGAVKRREVIDYSCNRCGRISTFKRWL